MAGTFTDLDSSIMASGALTGHKAHPPGAAHICVYTRVLTAYPLPASATARQRDSVTIDISIAQDRLGMVRFGMMDSVTGTVLTTTALRHPASAEIAGQFRPHRLRQHGHVAVVWMAEAKNDLGTFR